MNESMTVRVTSSFPVDFNGIVVSYGSGRIIKPKNPWRIVREQKKLIKKLKEELWFYKGLPIKTVEWGCKDLSKRGDGSIYTC